MVAAVRAGMEQLVSITDERAELADLVTRWTANDPTILADPYPLLARLRAEQPVFDTGTQVLVARHADAKAVLLDTAALSSSRFDRGTYADSILAGADAERRDKVSWVRSQMDTWLATLDGEEHAQLRRIVNPSFVSSEVAALRPSVQAAVDHLLDDVDRTHGSEFDFVATFGDQLPVSVICAFIGVPVERGPEIRRWAKTLAQGVYTRFADHRAVYDSYRAFGECVREQIALRREDPEFGDLLAHLVRGGGDRDLTEDEVVSFGVLLLFAGHETTTNLLGNTVVALLRNPEQLALLREDLSQVRRASDEFVRYCTSVHTMPRVAVRETEIAGHRIAPGTTVRALLGSANHDETVFEDAERLDITRRNARKHLGFGYGVHGCIGMHLARLELEVALTTILERYPRLALGGPVRMSANFSLYGPAELPLSV